jgi:hypothetical protein
LWRGGEEGGRVPSLRDDDVVEGLALVAEAGEADFDDHCDVTPARLREGG